MKFLCIVYQDERIANAMSKAERQELDNVSLDHDESLRKSGRYIHSNALQFADTARTLRLQNGKVVVTDGPFAETREQVGGYILLEAQDMNEAIQLASTIPPLRLGGIEIRPVQELKHS